MKQTWIGDLKQGRAVIYLRFQQDPSDLMLRLDHREQEQRRGHPFGGRCSDLAGDDGSWDRSRAEGGAGQ